MLYYRLQVRFLGIVLLGTFASLAWAAGGTDVVATSGAYVLVPPGWPPGTGEIVNDPCRTKGWNPLFSEWPNDVHHYALVIDSTDDLNRLIAKLAGIKSDLQQIRLSCQTEPRSLGFVTSMPEDNGISVLFTIGDQKQIDDWFKQLEDSDDNHDLVTTLVKGVVVPTPDRRTEKQFGKMTFAFAPTAIPPTLTVFVQNPLVDLEQLMVLIS